jgi:hypothetical protein
LPSSLPSFLPFLNPSLHLVPTTFTSSQVSKGVSIITKYRNLGNGLREVFPEFEWDLERFSVKGKKSMQKWYEEGGEEI